MSESEAEDRLPALPATAPANLPRTLQLPYHPSSSSALSSVRSVSTPRGTPSPSRRLATTVEEEYEADSEDDDEGTVPEDIVRETLGHWNTLRARARRSRSTDMYNLDSFILKWVENPRRAKQLAEALLKPKVQAALESKNVIVKAAGEDDDDIASKIRQELKPLQSNGWMKANGCSMSWMMISGVLT